MRIIRVNMFPFCDIMSKKFMETIAKTVEDTKDTQAKNTKPKST